MKLAQTYNLVTIIEINQPEIIRVNKLIMDTQFKDIYKVNDLLKLALYMEHVTDVNDTFDTIIHQNRIIVDNLNKMDDVIVFVDKCVELHVKMPLVINFVEMIIMEKISHFTDLNKIQVGDPQVIYPHCLNVFLLTKLDGQFVFKKLYLFLSHHLRYSGRNLYNLIKELDHVKYQSLLRLEHKFVDWLN